MKGFLLVFLGGGLGSGLRYLISNVMSQYSKTPRVLNVTVLSLQVALF